jgi:hypothetical protein
MHCKYLVVPRLSAILLLCKILSYAVMISFLLDRPPKDRGVAGVVYILVILNGLLD